MFRSLSLALQRLTGTGSPRLAVALMSVGLLGAFLGGPAAAAYPDRPIRIVVPFPPGAYTDSTARLIAQGLSQKWSQAVTVDNRPGAAGNIGTDYVAKSDPDGYTLIMATVANTISASLYKNLGHDFVKDLSPVSLIAAVPMVLVANPKLEVANVKQLIEYIDANPGKLDYASGGAGSSNHLAGELLSSMTRGKIVHVPYKGISPATAGLLGGQVSLMFASMDSALPHIRSGKMKVLAVTSATRAAKLPDVPTMIELGFEGFESAAWAGILAPAGTPKEVIRTLNAEIENILRTPEVQERLTGIGADIKGGSPEAFATFIDAEIRKWARIVKISGARVD